MIGEQANMFRFCTSWAIAMALSTFMPASTAGQVLFVDANATSLPEDGSTWCNAFRNPQSALAIAPAGTEIRVANGLYAPTGPSGNRGLSFQLKTGVALVGGFAGCGAPNPNERDIQIYLTVLTGDLNSDDGGGMVTENSYHVVAANLVDATAILDGFTITGAYADGSNPQDRGGGIFMYPDTTSPTIRNCNIRDNTVLAKGAAVYAFQSTALFENCIMENNQATDGGAVYLLQSAPTFVNCRFEGNEASALGGGTLNFESNATYEQCRFINNHALGGGGMHNFQSSPVVSRCLFLGNVVENALNPSGGGMLNQGSSPTISNSIFNGNFAQSRGGGIYCDLDSDPVIENCLLTNNEAAVSGGMRVRSSHATVVNSIFWENLDNSGNGEAAQITLSSGTINLDFSCVAGLTGGLGGTANIALDPQFANPLGSDATAGTLDDDFDLIPGSPCVDTGDAASVPNIGEVDWTGNPRVFCQQIDMGALELNDPAACSTSPIPTMGTWGLMILALLIITSGTLVFQRKNGEPSNARARAF